MQGTEWEPTFLWCPWTLGCQSTQRTLRLGGIHRYQRKSVSKCSCCNNLLIFFSFILIFQHLITLEFRKFTTLYSGATNQLKWKKKVLAGPLYPSSVRSEALSAADTDGLCDPVSTHTTCRHGNSPGRTVLAGILSRCNGEHLLALIYLWWPATRPGEEITQEIPKHTWIYLLT